MDIPAETVADEVPQSLQSVRHLPILEDSLAQHPGSVFTPIHPEKISNVATTVVESDKEDCNSRRMSREDLETMEIMHGNGVNDTNVSWPDTPETEMQADISTNDDSPCVNCVSRNEDSIISSTTPRNTDPILRQSSMFSSISAGDLIEYQWPSDDGGDYYMLQEQISTYLGITSFKRKYPEIERRKLDPQELNHLLLNMLLSEVQVTLGLTAVRSRDVCDMMMREYPEKYQEYVQVLDEKRKESIKNKHLQYSAPSVEKSQMPSYIKKAMKQVSDFNVRLNRQRKDEYAVYYDMQTNVLQFPRHRMKKVLPDLTRPSLYPCALIPGQFQEFCQKYTPEELNYFPLNTAVYGPPPPLPDEVESVHDSESERESQPDSMETKTADAKSQVSQDDGKGKETAAANVLEDGKTVSIPNDSENSDRNDAAEETLPETNLEKERVSDDAVVKAEADDSMTSYIDDPEKPVCGICLKDETCNKKGEPEDLISCSQCDNEGHPSCLDMSRELVSVIVTYNWQCLECKTCTYCSKPHHEDKMMFCDRCDRGYHTFCVGLRNLPSGLWMCPQCTRSDPDFAKKGGGKREKSSATPQKWKNCDDSATMSSDTPGKQRRKRRTKKEMEEAREKERQEKEERIKRKQEKREEREERKKRRRLKKEEWTKVDSKEVSPEQSDAALKEIKGDLPEKTVIEDDNVIANPSAEEKTKAVEKVLVEIEKDGS